MNWLSGLSNAIKGLYRDLTSQDQVSDLINNFGDNGRMAKMEQELAAIKSQPLSWG